MLFSRWRYSTNFLVPYLPCFSSIHFPPSTARARRVARSSLSACASAMAGALLLLRLASPPGALGWQVPPLRPKSWLLMSSWVVGFGKAATAGMGQSPKRCCGWRVKVVGSWSCCPVPRGHRSGREARVGCGYWVFWGVGSASWVRLASQALLPLFNIFCVFQSTHPQTYKCSDPSGVPVCWAETPLLSTEVNLLCKYFLIHFI